MSIVYVTLGTPGAVHEEHSLPQVEPRRRRASRGAPPPADSQGRQASLKKEAGFSAAADPLVAEASEQASSPEVARGRQSKWVLLEGGGSKKHAGVMVTSFFGDLEVVALGRSCIFAPPVLCVRVCVCV